MALALDGNVNGNTASSVSSFAMPTLTTANAGDLIFLAIIASNDVSSITDNTAGGPLTWIKRTSTTNIGLEVYYAIDSGNKFNSGAIITLHWAVNNGGFTTAAAWGISGADTVQIFDTNASIPKTTHVIPSDPESVSTNANDTFIYGVFEMNSVANPTVGTGFSGLVSANFGLAEFKIVASPQSGLSVGMNTGSGDSGASFIDAVIKAGEATAAWTPVNPIRRNWLTRRGLG